MSGFPDGAQPFAAVKYKEALLTLRASMAMLGEKGHSRFGTQDLRRGHAQDLKASGAPDEVIHKAGQWRGRRGQQAQKRAGNCPAARKGSAGPSCAVNCSERPGIEGGLGQCAYVVEPACEHEVRACRPSALQGCG